MKLVAGSMAVRRALPDEHHVLRYVPLSKRVIDPHGVPGGPAPSAFALRSDDEGGLSVTEVEFYGPCDLASRIQAAIAHRDSLPTKKVGTQAVYAQAQIASIKAAAAQYEKQVRVVHDPVPGNPGHAEVRHFTDDDLDLLAYFATDVFVDYETVASMKLA